VDRDTTGEKARLLWYLGPPDTSELLRGRALATGGEEQAEVLRDKGGLRE
jgi:hypothetical protein